jgi:hypothetical protein
MPERASRLCHHAKMIEKIATVSGNDSGGQVLGVTRWPKPGPARQDSKAKYDCVGRKDADEYLQEA